MNLSRFAAAGDLRAADGERWPNRAHAAPPGRPTRNLREAATAQHAKNAEESEKRGRTSGIGASL